MNQNMIFCMFFQTINRYSISLGSFPGSSIFRWLMAILTPLFSRSHRAGRSVQPVDQKNPFHLFLPKFYMCVSRSVLHCCVRRDIFGVWMYSETFLLRPFPKHFARSWLIVNRIDGKLILEIFFFQIFMSFS